MSLSFDELLLFGGDGSPKGTRAKSGDCHIATGYGHGPADGITNCR
jgi:hypothetical protein